MLMGKPLNFFQVVGNPLENSERVLATIEIYYEQFRAIVSYQGPLRASVSC